MALLAVCGLVGCSSTGLPYGRKPAAEKIAFVVASSEKIDDLARPWGMRPLRVDGVSLVTGLLGTGSDPPPSPEREMLLREMQIRRVEQPNRLLQSPNTSLVLVRGLIPPGAQEGDEFDVEILVPNKSETQSLANGWLMMTRLLEYAVVNGRLSVGDQLGFAQGPVVIEELLEGSNDATMKTRGRVLGGGRVKSSRTLGLVLRSEHKSFATSAQIGKAINERFYLYENGVRRGVAIPKTDDFVELNVHPSYVDNVIRYMRVIQNVGVRESDAERIERAEGLRGRLHRASTSGLAALELEALGSDSVRILKEALESGNEEVRFYAAEALAYMDKPEAAEVLGASAQNEPAFRYRALVALGAMSNPAAHEVLVSLLDEESAETRYGAFTRLRKLLPNDPMVAGEILGDCLHLHRVSSTAQPLVHVACYDRPEIVLFGEEVHLQCPCVLFAGNSIVVRGDDSGDVQVTRLTGAATDESIVASTNLSEVLKAIIEIEGSYCDVVEMLRQARSQHVLLARLEFSAIPETGRTYLRDQESFMDSEVQSPAEIDSPPESVSEPGLPVTDLTADMPATPTATSPVVPTSDLTTSIPEISDPDLITSDRTSGPVEQPRNDLVVPDEPESEWTPDQIDQYLDEQINTLLKNRASNRHLVNRRRRSA
jgi:flagellar basal body P-ring protein FlgI